ncbi:MAG: hypothetical protein HY553_19265 [Elusimicrobia bacterium]|nr:hypothetical protein [Elusimicrobiota bacterium]
MHVLHPLGQGRSALLLDAAPGKSGAGHAVAALCLAAVAACAALPYVNPDLFWHLSAARRIVETGAIPRADWLTYTRAGAPWVDFEWLAQLSWLAVQTLGGWWGLWALKVALFIGAAAVLWRTLSLHKLGLEAKAGWLLAWALALLPANDLRPEGYSLLLFSALWWRLESDRLGPARRLERRELALAAGYFLLWANLHAGFAYGLVLLALSAACAEGPRRVRLAALAAAAFAGTLVNPAGWRLYAVLVEHARDVTQLTHLIREWQAPTMKDPWLWPFWGLFLLSFSAILERQWKGELPREHALAVCLFGLSAGRHVRTAPYFAAVAVPVVAAALAALDRRHARLAARAAVASLLVYCGVRVAPRLGLTPFLPRYVPVALTGFLESEGAALGGLKIVHPVEWGGFLAWRLGPRFPVYADGRYLFHDLVKASSEALEDPDRFRAFVDGLGADVVLLKRSEATVWTQAAMKDHKQLALIRPAWLFFVPKPDWALVHFDDAGMVFVRRKRAPADWLKRTEYTIHRPGDEEAARWLIKQGVAQAAVLAAEKSRHEASPFR